MMVKEQLEESTAMELAGAADTVPSEAALDEAADTSTAPVKEAEEDVGATDQPEAADNADNTSEAEAALSGLEPSTAALDRELQALRIELEEMRAALTERKSSLEQLARELAELEQLFPGAKLGELPDAVWDELRQGTPLCAAVALTEKRREVKLKAAEESNRQNRIRSAGCPEKGKTDLFTPEEVRAMTSLEVRNNYQAIIKSMQKWS